MKRKKLKVIPYKHSKSKPWVVELGNVDGKRRRQFFTTKSEGDAWCRKSNARLAKSGPAAVHMPESLRIEATEAAELLKPYGKSLMDAARCLIASIKAVERSCTVSELIQEFQLARKADGASELYLKDLRHRLEVFGRDFGNRVVAEITTPALDDWLRKQGPAAQTRNNFRTVLRSTFEFAVVRLYAPTNPVAATSKAKVIRGEPEIFSPDIFRSLLHKAYEKLQNAELGDQARWRDTLTFMAIGGFAGLRTAEIERLDWEDIDLSEGLIHVRAKNAKSAQRRLVAISKNLGAWLVLLHQKSGTVINLNRVRDKTRSELLALVDLESWPANALRHSFASYHLAAFKDAASLSTELGHSSPSMLFQHYRNLVTPTVAESWWEIMPAADAENVVPFQNKTG